MAIVQIRPHLMIIIMITEKSTISAPTSVFGGDDCVCWQGIVGHRSDRMLDLTMSARLKLPWNWTSGSC